MRVDYRARVTYAAATPAVRAHASTVKKKCRKKISSARANTLRHSLADLLYAR
jgi:hypothetical protein